MTPHTDQPLTPAGLPEKRRTRYVPLDEFRRWKRRALIAYVFVVAAATLAAYLAWDAGNDSDAGLEQSGREATVRTCISGAELRIAVASGFDELRRLAVSNAPASQRELFIARTQPAIDRLLTQAAGALYEAPVPPGSVSREVASEVRDLARARCDARADESFRSAD